MATYWHKHPRGFANECLLLRADTPEQATRLEAEGFERLTRDQARRHLRWVAIEDDPTTSVAATSHAARQFRCLTRQPRDCWECEEASGMGDWSAQTYLAELEREVEMHRLMAEYSPTDA